MLNAINVNLELIHIERVTNVNACSKDMHSLLPIHVGLFYT